MPSPPRAHVPVISPEPLTPIPDFGPLDRLQGWAMTAVITALAAVTRFLNLGSPTDAGTPIFDEKHYAPQAWQMLGNHGVEDNPGYGLVVHPPVGKQLIAIGEALFGYNGLGWRFCGAVCGVVIVVLVARIVRRITRSTLIGGIAGLLIIADGVSFVTARTALLDVFLVVFVVAAFGALIVDRDQMRERMHVALIEGRIAETPWGPRLGVRWWRFGAGVLLGLAFAIEVVGPVLHAVLRRDDAGVRRGGARASTACRGRGWARCDATSGRPSTCWGSSRSACTWRRTRRGSPRRRPSTGTRRAGPSATAACSPTRSARCGTSPTAPTRSTRS